MRKRRITNNSIPFVVLLVLHILLLGFTLYKKREKGYFVLLLSNIGFAYLFEYFVLNIFQGYRYNPNILKNRHKDNLLGAIFSQAIYIPIIATTITAFRLGWKWKLLFSIYYGLIEYLFIYWKIFETRWWKTYYTFFFLFLFFKGSDIWYRLLKNNHPMALGITLYLFDASIYMNVLFSLSVLKKLRMGIGSVHSWKEHFVVIPIYSSLLSAIDITTYHIKLKYSYLLRFILVLIIDYLLLSFKIIKNMPTTFILLPIHIIMFFFSNKLFKKVYEVDHSTKVIDDL